MEEPELQKFIQICIFNVDKIITYGILEATNPIRSYVFARL